MVTTELLEPVKNEPDHAKLHELLIHELEDFAVFLVNPDGRIISWNPGVLRFFGYTQEEFIGKELAEIFTPEDRAAHAPQTEMENARRDGRASDIRWHLCQDQSRVFVEGVLLGIRSEAGDLVGFAKIARAVRPAHAAGSMIATLVEGRRATHHGERSQRVAGRGALIDVGDAESIEALLADIEAREGAVGILCNNAGITRDTLLLRMKEEDWGAVLDTNLASVFRLSKAVLRGMMKARKGRIVSITSVVGLTGNPGQANYAAAKAGIIGFTKSLAREVGSRGITVNAVAPGFIDTDMTRASARRSEPR